MDFFGRSLDNGLFATGAFMSTMNSADQSNLWALDFHSLVPDVRAEQSIAGWGCTSLIGPKPFIYLNPSGHAYSLFTICYKHQILKPESKNIPLYEIGLEDIYGRNSGIDTVNIPVLSVMATKEPVMDTVALFVLNRASTLPESEETYHDIQTTVRFQNDYYSIRIIVTLFKFIFVLIL